jgi:hypothetical protein
MRWLARARTRGWSVAGARYLDRSAWIRRETRARAVYVAHNLGVILTGD